MTIKILNLYETKKLHYGKYLYKLCINTPLAGIFRTELQRSGKLSYAKSKIDAFKQTIKSGEAPVLNRLRHSIYLTNDIIGDVSTIYSLLKLEKNYLIRCEYNTLTIFSNDRTLLLRIAKKINSAVEFWEPKKTLINLLENEQNIIIVKQLTDFNYKITFNRNSIKPEVAEWIRKNSDKIKAGKVLLYNIENELSVHGQYVYVKDEKVIFLLELMLGNAIRRIDKLVCHN